MPYLYLVGREDVVLTRGAADTMHHISTVTVTKFTPRTTVIKVHFTKPSTTPITAFKETVCAQVGRAACDGRVRLVCSRQDILAGVTINNQPLWGTPLVPDNPDIMFAQTVESYKPDTDETLYRPCTIKPPSGHVFGRVSMVGGGSVYVRVDARGRKLRDQPGDYLTTPSGARLPSKWVVDTTEIDHECARVVREEVLPGGYHPVVAIGTPNSMRLLVQPPATVGDDWCAHVVTTWSGDVMHPPTVLRADSLDAALDMWADAIKALVSGEQQPTTTHNHQTQQLIVRARCEYEAPTKHVRPLEVGEHVAYLAQDVPPEDQHEFLTAKVTGLNPFELSNGHHDTVFADGVGQLARYDTQGARVLFPVFNLRDAIQ